MNIQPLLTLDPTLPIGKKTWVVKQDTGLSACILGQFGISRGIPAESLLQTSPLYISATSALVKLIESELQPRDIDAFCFAVGKINDESNSLEEIRDKLARLKEVRDDDMYGPVYNYEVC